MTTSQTFAIIKKIGNHAKQGIHVDTVTLDREINAARLALRGMCVYAHKVLVLFIDLLNCELIQLFLQTVKLLKLLICPLWLLKRVLNI